MKVLVTGANRGIGFELARQLAARGDTVYLGARTEAKASTAAATISGDVVPVELDVAEPAHAARVAESLPALDVLINNAAIHYDTWQRFGSPDFEVVEQAWQTNVIGAWRLATALVPLLRKGTSPRIVNVSSEAGSMAAIGSSAPAYAVSKVALNAVTRGLAADLRRHRILVNAVCPGWIATDMGGPGGAPVAEGAASVLWAVDLPDDGPTGGFFRHGRPLPW
ncbi:SDR family NAD(P)-dependent oxidoreductase [Labedaea rhizosphaerae]|uniref:Short-subunit dehydrogenase n=1 Tax=Labedaea rhizosphaerae TaxID=598644 RepID=A0A4R6RYQ0_LABRH|nr:SDR family NAD(P)-dependent oxidoreductase [Labedaea rhizosphaerae]TDP92073.1 short-subunit dehydrogenase [Labedaea rhizosphaerae]